VFEVSPHKSGAEHEGNPGSDGERAQYLSSGYFPSVMLQRPSFDASRLTPGPVIPGSLGADEGGDCVHVLYKVVLFHMVFPRWLASGDLRP
jgi:hypothetical protein